jgi:hypothetical protein
MKSQSCATRSGFEAKPTSAGPIERAGLTEVPVMLMPTRWMTTSVKPMASPAKPVGAKGCVTPRTDQEQEGSDQLEDEGRNHVVFADIAWAPAVLEWSEDDFDRGGGGSQGERRLREGPAGG